MHKNEMNQPLMVVINYLLLTIVSINYIIIAMSQLLMDRRF